jgi:hypothetical protein
MQLLRRGYDVYEGDNFVEVYEGEGEEYWPHRLNTIKGK